MTVVVVLCVPSEMVMVAGNVPAAPEEGVPPMTPVRGSMLSPGGRLLALKVRGVQWDALALSATVIAWPGVLLWSPGDATTTSSVGVMVIVTVVPPLGTSACVWPTKLRSRTLSGQFSNARTTNTRAGPIGTSTVTLPITAPLLEVLKGMFTCSRPGKGVPDVSVTRRSRAAMLDGSACADASRASKKRVRLPAWRRTRAGRLAEEVVVASKRSWSHTPACWVGKTTRMVVLWEWSVGGLEVPHPTRVIPRTPRHTTHIHSRWCLRCWCTISPIPPPPRVAVAARRTASYLG